MPLYASSNVGAGTPGFDPVTNTVPEHQPDKTLAEIKQQAKILREQRREQGSSFTPEQKQTFSRLQQIQTDRSGVLRVNTKPGLRSAARAAFFGTSAAKVTEVKPVPAFLATEEEIVVAGLTPTAHVVQGNKPATQINGQNFPVAVATEVKQNYDEAMSNGGVYAGLATLFREKQIGAYQHVILDTSGSMGATDAPEPFERNADSQYIRVDGLRNEWQPNHPHGTRIQELQSRMIDALPDLLRANTGGHILFETFSHMREKVDTDASYMRGVEGKYNANLSRLTDFVRSTRPDTGYTPTLSFLLNAFKAAEREERLHNTKVTLITDGAASEEHIDEVERDFAAYKRDVVQGNADFINKKGERVPNEVARLWYMDKDSREIDRRVSFIIGQYGIPVNIGACTNVKKHMRELNEIDGLHTGRYSKCAVLDDAVSEAKETAAQNPWFNFTPRIANMALWSAAEIPEFDIVDERPATPKEREAIVGFEMPLEGFEEEIKVTELGQRSKFERDTVPPASYVPPAYNPAYRY